MAGNEINKSYVEYPRLGDLLGVARDQWISDPPPIVRLGDRACPRAPLADSWTPTGANIPADGGKVSTIALPGTMSGFQPRES